MSSWQSWIGFALATMLSGWLPILGLRILRERKEPVYPSFFCEVCRASVSWCAICSRHVVISKWKTRMIFSGLGMIGMAMLSDHKKNLFFCFFLFLILVSLIDIWSKLIPNRCTLWAFCFFFLMRLFFEPAGIGGDLFTAGVVYVSLSILCGVTRAMGGGDAKLLSVCSVVLGWQLVILAFWVATLSALLFIGYRSISRPLQRKEAFPFAPHIAIGCYIAYIGGEHIFYLYFRFVSLYEAAVLSFL